MKKNRGFTLIELLAIIVILAIILGIAIPTIINMINSSKLKSYENQKGLVENAARLYEFSNSGDTSITIAELVAAGYLAEDEAINPIDNSVMDGYVEVTTQGNTPIYTYHEGAASIPVALFATGLSGNDYEAFSGLAPVTGGGFVAVGRSSSTDISGLTNAGEYDHLIVKYDVDGNILWKKSSGGLYYDELYRVIETSDGGFVAVGETGHNDQNDESHAYIVKYDASGTELWSHTWVDTNDNIYFDVAELNDGTLRAVGITDWHTTTSECRIVKYTAAGAVASSIVINDGDTTGLTTITALSNGGYAVGGMSRDATIPGIVTSKISDVYGLVLQYDSADVLAGSSQIETLTRENITLSEIIETRDGHLVVAGAEYDMKEFLVDFIEMLTYSGPGEAPRPNSHFMGAIYINDSVGGTTFIQKDNNALEETGEDSYSQVVQLEDGTIRVLSSCMGNLDSDLKNLYSRGLSFPIMPNDVSNFEIISYSEDLATRNWVKEFTKGTVGEIAPAMIIDDYNGGLVVAGTTDSSSIPDVTLNGNNAAFVLNFKTDGSSIYNDETTYNRSILYGSIDHCSVVMDDGSDLYFFGYVEDHIECNVENFTVPNTFNGEEIGGILFITGDPFYLDNVTLSTSATMVIGFSALMGGEPNPVITGEIDTLVVPGNIITIGPAAFAGISLNSVTFNEGLENIVDYAFANNDLTDVYIPDSVTQIGEHAFDQNDNLATASVPAGATIDATAFPATTTVTVR